MGKGGEGKGWKEKEDSRERGGGGGRRLKETQKQGFIAKPESILSNRFSLILIPFCGFSEMRDRRQQRGFS